jgi:hypothetical protein
MTPLHPTPPSGLIMSPTVGKIVPALIRARKKFEPLVKNAKAPRGNGYANLEAVLDVVVGTLLEEGVLPVQSVEGTAVQTAVLHEEGEYIISGLLSLPLPPQVTKEGPKDPTPPEGGICISYARRYGLLAFFALNAEDPDGDLGRDSSASFRTEAQAAIDAATRIAQLNALVHRYDGLKTEDREWLATQIATKRASLAS